MAIPIYSDVELKGNALVEHDIEIGKDGNIYKDGDLSIILANPGTTSETIIYNAPVKFQYSMSGNINIDGTTYPKAIYACVNAEGSEFAFECKHNTTSEILISFIDLADVGVDNIRLYSQDNKRLFKFHVFIVLKHGENAPNSLELTPVITEKYTAPIEGEGTLIIPKIQCKQIVSPNNHLIIGRDANIVTINETEVVIDNDNSKISFQPGDILFYDEGKTLMIQSGAPTDGSEPGWIMQAHIQNGNTVLETPIQVGEWVMSSGCLRPYGTGYAQIGNSGNEIQTIFLKDAKNEYELTASKLVDIQNRLSGLGFSGGYGIYGMVYMFGESNRKILIGYIARFGKIEYGYILSPTSMKTINGLTNKVKGLVAQTITMPEFMGPTLDQYNIIVPTERTNSLQHTRIDFDRNANNQLEIKIGEWTEGGSSFDPSWAYFCWSTDGQFEPDTKPQTAIIKHVERLDSTHNAQYFDATIKPTGVKYNNYTFTVFENTNTDIPYLYYVQANGASYIPLNAVVQLIYD